MQHQPEIFTPFYFQDVDSATFHLLNQFPKAVVLWRLSSMREVILSGFQLELYHPMERPFAYWFAAQVIDIHLRYLDTLLSGKTVVPPGKFVSRTAVAFLTTFTGSPSHTEMQYQKVFLTALQAMSIAMFAVCPIFLRFCNLPHLYICLLVPRC